MTNDIDELTVLNRDFVASVQNSDVRRFDEILALEFYCSNPDKSLVDRAAFLEQTAKPVAIKNLRAHDVKIRIMSDFAIIQLRPAIGVAPVRAATSYTTPDRQQANFVIADRTVRVGAFPVGIETAAFVDLARNSMRLPL